MRRQGLNRGCIAQSGDQIGIFVRRSENMKMRVAGELGRHESGLAAGIGIMGRGHGTSDLIGDAPHRLTPGIPSRGAAERQGAAAFAFWRKSRPVIRFGASWDARFIRWRSPMTRITRRQFGLGLGLGPLAMPAREAAATVSGPGVLNDMLLSGSIEFVNVAPPSLATLWEKTIGTQRPVRALCTVQSMPYVLVTRNAKVRTIADFTDADKIAVPTVKISGQAMILQIAAAKVWGFDQYERLDPLTVSMGLGCAGGRRGAGR